MEGDNVVDLSITGGAAAVAAAGYSRWNPTKEQIDMLEGLYKQGIRTPSAEQIQQITNRLRAFGHIEGKNVFYWFQNHKARQRQKQKQDTISYFNRFLQKTSVFPPCPNVICSPFCIPYTDLGLSHQQQPKVLLPRAFKRKPAVPEKMAATTNPTGGALEKMANDHQNYCNVTEECLIKRKHRCNNQTLDLFPLHPTGNLQARTSSSSLASNSLGDSGILTTPGNSSSDSKCITVEQGGSSGTGLSTGHLFFDFFCENYGSCESH